MIPVVYSWHECWIYWQKSTGPVSARKRKWLFFTEKRILHNMEDAEAFY